jgi:hypothetical protein
MHIVMRISGPKRDDMLGGLRKLLNEEIHDLYFSPNIIITQILKGSDDGV